jgi:ligand-binding sensor domain-containing protein/two-component sensor histidine kinase
MRIEIFHQHNIEKNIVCIAVENFGKFILMQVRILMLLLVMLLQISFGKAQQVSFIKYTVYDGLVSNPVRCIYQDKKGYIWIGTYDGLSRYDGYQFKNFTSVNGLSHSVVNNIFEAGEKLLIAENDGSVDVIHNNITIEKSLKVASAVNAFGVHNNRILGTTDSHGFIEYKNNSIASTSGKNYRMPLGNFLSLNDTMILSAGTDDDIYLYKKDFTIQDSLELPGMVIASIVQDSKKRIWICSSIGLLLLQITPENTLHISTEPLPVEFNFSILNEASITSIIEEKDGSFWISTLKGLVHVFPDGNFYVYNEKDGLPSARIFALHLDKEENLWIGTSLGLAKYVSRSNVVFYNTETLDYRNDVVAISSSDDHKIILKTDLGLQDFNLTSRQFKNIIVPGNLDPVSIANTSPLLVHYPGHIGMLDNKTNTVIPITKLELALSDIITGVQHPEGMIFLGAFSGVYAIKNGSVQKLLPHRITSIAVDKRGYIWAGTWNKGLFRIKIKNSTQDLYDIHDMTETVKETQIRGLYADSKKNIWVGTRYGGAFCLTLNENESYETRHFTRQSGLMSDWVISFAETKTGDMWVGTYLGLDRIVKQTSGYRIFNFSKAVNFFAEIKKIILTGNHWICVANTGIAIFEDENLHKSRPINPVIFSSSLGALENKITVFHPVDKITLKPFQNAAHFEFGALSFINERQILYSYRLKGISDTTWSKPANIHEATYESLSPGEYTFEVKSLGWNGEYSTPATFFFVIATPFWKQWWFIALCAVLVAAMVYGLYRYRIKQIMRLQKVRNTIATDLHDDIGSALTNISILAELSRNKNQQGAFAENLPGRISEESTLAQQALDDIIWSVNSNNDNLNQTMARMRRYAAEVFEPVGINCKIDFESIPGDHKLNMEQRKDIYLVFKECINNVIKHADANNAFIKIDLNKDLFNLKIEDDGKGFDPLKDTDRNGVKNIRSRIERWNGKLAIHSSPGKGTTVDCSFPLASLK